jgi:hypothetical protein
METYNHFCEKCNYGTDNKYVFAKHLETILHKTGEKKRKPKKDKYKCDKCDYETTKTNNFKNHMLNNHSTKEERQKEFKYYCELCDFGVFTKVSYNAHLESTKHKRQTYKK